MSIKVKQNSYLNGVFSFFTAVLLLHFIPAKSDDGNDTHTLTTLKK